MSRVDVSEVAELDLEEIWLYVALDNAEAADRHLDRLRRQFQSLAEHPGIGRERSDLAENVRSFPKGNYVIFYRPIDNGVVILRVREGHRDIGSEDFE